MNIRFFLAPLSAALILFFSCKKWSDPNPDPDPSLADRKYCNDPEAVNYNWGFPGTPDNSVCIFPADLYAGTYQYTDSVYSTDNILDSALSLNNYTLQITPISKSRFIIRGYCTSDSISFKAERSTYMANADTTIRLNDTTLAYGQFLCRTLDTLSGFIQKSRTDSTILYIDWRVVSDTGIHFHRGTAIKQ